MCRHEIIDDCALPSGRARAPPNPPGWRISQPTGWTVGCEPMKRPSSVQLPDALLDAAEAVVARQGIANLTLDAVAAEVGMSKGGVLHHFPTKDRLVEAMVVRSAEAWRATFTQRLRADAAGPRPHGASALPPLPVRRQGLDARAATQLRRVLRRLRAEPEADRARCATCTATCTSASRTTVCPPESAKRSAPPSTACGSTSCSDSCR